MIIDEKVYLEHVGVKGMKWGVRKSEKSSSRNGKWHYGLPLNKMNLEQRALLERSGILEAP